MQHQTFNVRFILKADKTNQKGLTPIYAKITLNGERKLLATNRQIEEIQWSTDLESALPGNKTLRDLNSYLEMFKSKIYLAYSSILSGGECIDINALKLAIFGKPSKKGYTLLEVGKEHNDQFEKLIGIKYSYGSFKNYKTTLKYLTEFIPLKFKKQDFPLDKIDYKFCESYFEFLTTIKTCNNNGANKQIQRLKKIVNYAVRLGYIVSNPTDSFTLQFKPTNKIPLSINEIHKLANFPLQRESLNHVRNIFIFQCYTGLSYSDIKGLKRHHICIDQNEYWVKMERQKTSISFSVLLLNPAMKLLKEYLAVCSNNEFIFPVLSNQKMNDNLKIIQEIVGIAKNLTTHLARHSFATTITLNNDVPIETVSRMLGHTNIRTTQLYAKVLDDKIGCDMRKLMEKLV